MQMFLEWNHLFTAFNSVASFFLIFSNVSAGTLSVSYYLSSLNSNSDP